MRIALRMLAGSQHLRSQEHVRELLDLAYRLDPEFAHGLVSLVEEDASRADLRGEIHREITQLGDRDDQVRSLGRKAGALPSSGMALTASCREGLAEVVRGRLSPASFDAIIRVVKRAGTLPTEDGYWVFAWAVRNSWCRRDARSAVLGKLEEVWAGLGVALHHYSALVAGANLREIPRGWRLDETAQKTLHLRAGQRDRALGFVKAWLGRVSAESLWIVDPWFGVDDVPFLFSIFRARQDTVTRVLAGTRGRSHDLDRFRDDVHHAWRRVTREVMPSVEFTVISRADSVPVLHQRYLIAPSEGLELGCGWKDLGRAEAKLTRFDEYALEQVRHNFGCYVDQTAREDDGSPLTYHRVWLGG